MKKEDILRQQPFRWIGKIIGAESLEGPGAISGDSFKVTTTDGKMYKLRYLDSLRYAQQIEKNVNLFPKAFPTFYGREGRYVLFEWIDGERLASDISKEDSYKVGKLCGEAHQLNEMGSKQKLDRFIKNRVVELGASGKFKNSFLAKVDLKFEEYKKKLNIDIVLEFTDIHPRNFMKDKKGKIYYVDEEGFKHAAKGLGLAKVIGKWMKTRVQQEAFWRGYNKHHSSDYFDKDYEEFVKFLQAVRTISTRLRTGRTDYKTALKRLEARV